MKQFPFKDLNGKSRTMDLHFNLYEREVFKLMVEFKAIFDWQERLKEYQGQVIDLPTEDVLVYYNNLEEIILSAYGIPDDDGLSFEKSGRYKFEQSPMFSELMNQFVSDPRMSTTLIDGLMPQGLQAMVKRADDNLAKEMQRDDTSEDAQARIAELRSQLAEITAAEEKRASGSPAEG